MLENKNNVTEVKNASDRLINMLYTVEERISELKNMSLENSKMENRREKKKAKKNYGTEYLGMVGQHKK